MVKHEFSYWLTVTPGEQPKHTKEELLDILNSSKIDLHFEIKGNEITGEVDPNVGTTQEDSDLIGYVQELAIHYPDYDFTFQECDEEDHSCGATTKWSRGEEIFKGHIRTVPSDRQYDSVTVDAIASYLSDCDCGNLADAIREEFDC